MQCAEAGAVISTSNDLENIAQRAELEELRKVHTQVELDKLRALTLQALARAMRRRTWSCVRSLRISVWCTTREGLFRQDSNTGLQCSLGNANEKLRNKICTLAVGDN